MSGSIVPLILYPFASRTAKILHVPFISTWELQCKTTCTTQSIFTPYISMCFLDRCFCKEMRADERVVDTCRLWLGSGTGLQEGE
jgi:hypothetical protein